jgi:hypothetical protein
VTNRERVVAGEELGTRELRAGAPSGGRKKGAQQGRAWAGACSRQAEDTTTHREIGQGRVAWEQSADGRKNRDAASWGAMAGRALEEGAGRARREDGATLSRGREGHRGWGSAGEHAGRSAQGRGRSGLWRDRRPWLRREMESAATSAGARLGEKAATMGEGTGCGRGREKTESRQGHGRPWLGTEERVGELGREVSAGRACAHQWRERLSRNEEQRS